MPTTPNTTITITLDDVQGNTIGSAGNPAYVEIALCNFGPFLPRIAGTAMIAKAGPYRIPFTGSPISVNLWSNDQIIPAGTFYAISILDDSKNVLQTGAYTFTGTVNADLSTIAQTFPSVSSSVAGGMVTVPFSATPQFNAFLLHAPVAFDITLTGNVTGPTLIGLYPGQIVTFIIVQDAIGGHTFAWPSQVKNAGIVDPAANSVTTQMFVARANGNLYPVGPQTYS